MKAFRGGRETQQQKLALLLSSTDSTTVTNRLMSAADRAIALAAYGCDHSVRERLFARIPGNKQGRVREELALLERRRFRAQDVEIAVSDLVRHIEGARERQNRGYLRPVNKSRGN